MKKQLKKNILDIVDVFKALGKALKEWTWIFIPFRVNEISTIIKTVWQSFTV